MNIDSKQNKTIKETKKLYDKKYRDLNNKFIVEGKHLVDEAYKAGVLEYIITSGDYDLDVKTFTTTDEIIKYMTNLPSPQNIIGVCKKNEKQNIGDKILILDQVQDPGNLGTLIRSSVAFDIDTIVLSDNSVDLYNPKVIRSTQGMLFNINIIKTNTNT